MVNQTGIAIVIKAFLPTGKTLDEQFAALSAVKTAHETSDYAALLKLASIEDVKTEQKTRRVEEPAPQPAAPQPPVLEESKPEQDLDGGDFNDDAQKPDEAPEAAEAADVPAFIKGKKKAA